MVSMNSTLMVVARGLRAPVGTPFSSFEVSIPFFVLSFCFIHTGEAFGWDPKSLRW